MNSLKGELGERGEHGKDGNPGALGTPGPLGPVGFTGKTGMPVRFSYMCPVISPWEIRLSVCGGFVEQSMQHKNCVHKCGICQLH